MKTRWFAKALWVVLGPGLSVAACGGSASTSENEGEGTGSSSEAGGGDGKESGEDETTSSNGDSGDESTGKSGGPGSSEDEGDVTKIIEVVQIPGGGVNSAPLAPGCGPETAHECMEPGGSCNNEDLIQSGGVEVKDAGATCFFGEEMTTPSATVEYITEVVAENEYVHLRVIFDPDFVDTVYGECSAETGWNPRRGHTFKDLRSSDHVELMLYNCSDELSMHMKVDFLDTSDSTACGYATGGVLSGDGEMFVGDPEQVLAVGTSLDRNMNGCGYCDDMASPCPSDDSWGASEEAPEWDFRMVYELWIDAEAFGDAGFCRPDIEYVHASPSKASTDTILVEPDDCPPPDEPPDEPPGNPPPGDDCPVDFELFLTSEGEFWCAGPPDEGGNCPAGYEIDITSEGELCIPEGKQ